MKRWHIGSLLVIAGGAIVVVQSATADFRRDNSIWARLIGLQEVPVVLTAGRAWFRADIADDEQSIEWTLTYERLQADVTQAHLHIGQPSVNGGISVWMCANPNPPALTARRPDSATANVSATGRDDQRHVDVRGHRRPGRPRRCGGGVRGAGQSHPDWRRLRERAFHAFAGRRDSRSGSPLV